MKCEAQKGSRVTEIILLTCFVRALPPYTVNSEEECADEGKTYSKNRKFNYKHSINLLNALSALSILPAYSWIRDIFILFLNSKQFSFFTLFTLFFCMHTCSRKNLFISRHTYEHSLHTSLWYLLQYALLYWFIVMTKLNFSTMKFY